MKSVGYGDGRAFDIRKRRTDTRGNDKGMGYITKETIVTAITGKQIMLFATIYEKRAVVLSGGTKEDQKSATFSFQS